MEALFDSLGSLGSWKDELRAACKENGLCTSLAGQLTPSKLAALQDRFKKAYELNQDSFSECWIEHEMKAFNWILIVLSTLKNVKIREFTHSEWLDLSRIFPYKTSAFLRYQTRRFLLQRCTKNKNWSQEENQMLSDIVAQCDQNKLSWNQIARALFQQSQQKYFRTAKHCRERWLNYIDPSKKRGDWNNEQDIQLLEKIEEHGKKWAKIGSLLNRTEHCVKNRFNSMLSKQKRLTPNIRKEEKLIEQTKRNCLQNPNEPLEQEVLENPTLKITYKMSSQSIFCDNKSPSRQLFQTFGELQKKNSLEYLENYTIEGEEFIRHMVRDEPQEPKNEAGSGPSFWCNSPKNLTPMAISPSPLSLNFGANYYLHNFHNKMRKASQMQRQGDIQDKEF